MRLARPLSVWIFGLLAAGGGAAAQEPRPWTVLIYGAADNNADGPIFHFLEDLRQNAADDPGLHLVFWVDRSAEFSSDAHFLGEDFTGARLFEVHADRVERLAGGDEFPEVTLDGDWEPDSADPENLRKFIAFGKQHYPAQRTALLIYSHADGRGMCPDEESGREMGIAELTHVLDEDASVDFTALELCNMAGLEIAYQWRPGSGGFATDVLLAIPNAGPPLDWGRAFARLRTPGSGTNGQTFDPATLTAADFGRLVVEEGGLGRLEAAKEEPERAQWEAVSAYDLHAVEAAKVAVDDWAVAIVATGGREALQEVRGPGPQGCVMNYARDNIVERPYVDAYDLARRAAACAKLDPEARAAAEVVMQRIDDLVLASFGMSGYEGFEPGKHGVFLVFPVGEHRGGPLAPDVWKMQCWYSPLEPPENIGTYGRWDFCGDGATPDNGVVENWFEMLDSWYDDPDPDTGGHNGYRW